jgi:putative endonuclease
MITVPGDLGRYGEQLAREYLEAQGLRILECNYHFHHAELDIIAEDGDVLVFCEVKTRRDRQFGTPEQAVTARKVRQIRRVAGAYLSTHRICDRQCRFDVIGIVVGSGVARLNHLRNAFW